MRRTKKEKDPANDGAFPFLHGTSLLVLMPLRLHALVVFVLRHFFAAFLLDGTHLDFSFVDVLPGTPALLENYLVEGELDDARCTSRAKRRDEIAHKPLLDNRLNREPIRIVQPVDRRSMECWKHLDDLLEILRRCVELEKHTLLGVKGTEKKHLELLDLRTLGRALPRLLVRYHASGGSENRIDNAEIVGAERGSRLRKVNNGIHKLRSLHLCSAPAELDIGLDAVLLEVALHKTDSLSGYTLALEILDSLDLGIVRNRKDPTNRIRCRLRVVEFADLLNIGTILIHPIISADAGIKEPELHIAAHLLRTEQAALDIRIVNGGNVAP